MATSPLSLGIATALSMMGLVGLWRLQHRLDRRGYLLQAAIILAGSIFIAVAFPRLPETPAVALFDSGVILVTLFLLCPEIIYQLLRLYDRGRRQR